ncbi:hypothetical protein L596_029830 [Steinernema carpocapsae]|uniref:Uncharacterized protein n=1 Tax=Steinernema carpocapsae TaxID=34508 RepID=A0A4V6XVK4_STECR|nr:hypothetical protein L596_029819 [Steinernema carpocapsae]TKR58377.1 hypothetical protein L596_029830 [Steinernema carpocapsae]
MFRDFCDALAPEYVCTSHPQIQVLKVLLNREEGLEVVTWRSPSDECDYDTLSLFLTLCLVSVLLVP